MLITRVKTLNTIRGEWRKQGTLQTSPSLYCELQWVNVNETPALTLAGFSLWRPGFNPSRLQVRFVMDEVSLEKDFSDSTVSPADNYSTFVHSEPTSLT